MELLKEKPKDLWKDDDDDKYQVNSFHFIINLYNSVT